VTAADRNIEMRDSIRILARPEVAGLTTILTHQRRLLERLLYRTRQLELLIDAGEGRFVARALDETSTIEEELAASEMARAVVTQALVAGTDTEPTLTAIASVVDDGEAALLHQAGAEVIRLYDEVAAARRRAEARAGSRAADVRHRASRRGGGYGPDGSAA